MTHILLVDDDPEILDLLSVYLQRYQLRVSCAADGMAMHAALEREPVDLVVLDWMLPGTDGLTLATQVRARSRVPIIMLTARSGRFDCVTSLENGVDDYMSKPFEPRELVARIHSVLRRVQTVKAPAVAQEEAAVVAFDGWRLHRLERHLVSPTGMVLALSNAEFRLLSVFIRHPRKLLAREQLLDEARGRDTDAFDRSIDLLVSRLRQKLAKGWPSGAPVAESLGGVGGPEQLIRTVRGGGYLFQPQHMTVVAEAWAA